MMTRAEHLQWAKDRALEYADQGDTGNAMASLRVGPWQAPGHCGIRPASSRS